MSGKKTVKDIMAMKAKGEKIAMLTAYDAPTASALYNSGVDVLLVGDSLGMVVLGYDSTVPVTMDDMVHHTKAVRRGAPDAFVVSDMPYGSYQVSVSEAISNGFRLMKEGGADAVKLEGGAEIVEVVKGLVRAGIPVVGHLGLTPQTASQLGGYKVQGKDEASARKMYSDVKLIADAGACMITLECVPAELARVLTAAISVPTIGIGAGIHCDGQVLVVHDMLGVFQKFTPKFVKKYSEIAPVIEKAVSSYVSEVKQGTFPDEGRSFSSSCNFQGFADIS